MESNLFGIVTYSVKDIADLLLIDSETVRKWIREKKINAIKQGSRKDGYLITGSDFLNFLNFNPKYARRIKRIYDKDYLSVIEIQDTCYEDKLFKSIYNKIPYELFVYLIFRYSVENDIEIIATMVEESLGSKEFKKVTGLRTQKEREAERQKLEEIFGEY